MHIDYNPFLPSFIDNPYPRYARLRAEAPVYHAEELGFWVISRYRDVVDVLHDPATFSSARGIGPAKNEVIHRPTLLTRDPPDHTRLRSIVSKAFTPKMVAELEPRIRVITVELLERALGRERFDLLEELSVPLPLRIIAEMLGVEPDRREDFKRWSTDVVAGLAGRRYTKDRERVKHSYEEFDRYLAVAIEEHRRQPRADLLSALVEAEESRQRLSASEVRDFCILLIIAGNETTTQLIANAVLALIEHPEEDAKLRAHPEFTTSAVEEVLRFDAPLLGVFRTTTRPVTVAGVTIPAGEKVQVLYGSANRDEAQFPDPDRFDIERSPNAHIAFGLGPHFCLGASLGRLEARVALEEIYARLPALRLAPGSVVERLEHPVGRPLKSLELVTGA